MHLESPRSRTKNEEAAMQQKLWRNGSGESLGARQAAKKRGAPVTENVGAAEKVLGNAAEIISSSPKETEAAVTMAAKDGSERHSERFVHFTAKQAASPVIKTEKETARAREGEDVPAARAGARAARQRTEYRLYLLIYISPPSESGMPTPSLRIKPRVKSDAVFAAKTTAFEDTVAPEIPSTAEPSDAPPASAQHC